MSSPPPQNPEDWAELKRYASPNRHLQDPAALQAAQARVAEDARREAARKEAAWKAAARRLAYEATRHSQQGDVQGQQPPRLPEPAEMTGGTPPFSVAEAARLGQETGAAP
jgi:uncharacterized protein YdaU (DUF1376 family)